MILTFAQIKEVTGLAAIVSETRKVTPFLTQAQYELRKILGTTLYAQLEVAIAANFVNYDNLSTLFTTYVKEPLAWRTLQLAYPRLYSEPTANGVHTVSDTNYTPVDGRTMAMQVSVCRDFADQGYERMLAYLRENLATYPSYATNVGCEERVTKTYPGGVITRVSKWQKPYGIDNVNDFDTISTSGGEGSPDTGLDLTSNPGYITLPDGLGDGTPGYVPLIDSVP